MGTHAVERDSLKVVAQSKAKPQRLNGVNLPALARPTQFSHRLPIESVNLRELERAVLTEALRHTAADPGKAAALLGLTVDQIRHRMAKLGMDMP